VEHLPVGVEDEGNVFHLAVGEAFFERNTEPLEAGTGSLDVGDSEGDVAEAAGLGVARVVRGAFEGLSAVVVRQLEDTWLSSISKLAAARENDNGPSRSKRPVSFSSAVSLPPEWSKEKK